jgi:hypothetical protein
MEPAPAPAATSNIAVFARVRPATRAGAAVVVSVDPEAACLVVGAERYAFTHASGPEASQEAMFEAAGRPISESALAGYNCTLFAYGQTGSGKTHTIYGPGEGRGEPAQRGLLPRTLDYLFAQMRSKEEASGGRLKFTVKASFLEVRGRAGRHPRKRGSAAAGAPLAHRPLPPTLHLPATPLLPLPPRTRRSTMSASLTCWTASLPRPLLLPPRAAARTLACRSASTRSRGSLWRA